MAMENLPTKERWLDLALTTLAERGYESVKALSLAKKLGVTRGSFYHHFESIEQFQREVIARWSQQTSEQLIELANAQNDASKGLDVMLQRAFCSQGQLERAVRSWATVYEDVAQELEKVDQLRITAARDLIVDCGLPPVLAETRAKLLYWAAIGRLMMPFPQKSRLSPNEISDLMQLMLTHS